MVFAIGLPIGMARDTSETRVTVDQMVVSVRAIQVPELPTRCEEPDCQIARKRFATAQHLESGLAGPSCVEQQAPRRGRRLHDRDIAAIEQLRQRYAIQCNRARSEHNRAACAERSIYFQAGYVE